MRTNNEIVSNSVPTSASININNFKFHISGGADFNSFAEAIKWVKDIAVGNSILVRGELFEGVRIALLRNDGEYELRCFVVEKDFSASHKFSMNFGKRMTDKKIEEIGRVVCLWLNSIRKEYMDMEWENIMVESEKLNEIVCRYQGEFDGYVADLKKIAENIDGIKSRFDFLRAWWIMKKIDRLGEDMLFALGDETNCSMVSEDGYWFDTEELARWFGYGGNYGETIWHFGDLIDTLYNQAYYEPRIVPFTSEEEEDIMDCHLTEEEIDGNEWGFGLGYALALYECSDMEEEFKEWYENIWNDCTIPF